MRILQITHNYPSASDRTSGVFLHRIFKALVHAVDITVVLLRPSLSVPRIANTFMLDGVRVIEVRYFRPRGRVFNTLDGIFMLSALRCVAPLAKRSSVIHAHWQTDAGIVGAYLAAHYSRPLVVSVRGTRIFSRSVTTPYGILSSMVFRRARIVHTHGPNIRARLLGEFRVPGEQLMLIPNIIFNERELESLRARNSHKPTRKEGYRFLFVGLDGKNKGLLDAIRAFIGADNQHHQLDIVTDTRSRFFCNEARPMIAGRQNIRVMGSSAPELIRDLFVEADAFIFPSLGEGLPNVVVEAMAAGCFIVAYRIPGLDQLVIHNLNGRLVERGDIQGLTAELEAFGSGRMTSEHGRYKAYNDGFVAQRYDLQSLVGDYLNMYRACLVERE